MNSYIEKCFSLSLVIFEQTEVRVSEKRVGTSLLSIKEEEEEEEVGEKWEEEEEKEERSENEIAFSNSKYLSLMRTKGKFLLFLLLL